MALLKNSAWLVTGSNMGQRESLLQQAVEHINKECGHVVRLSHLYQTAAWGIEDQPPFLNQALQIETAKTAEELLQCLLQIELSLGRHRAEKYGPRLIDIDIIFFNDEVVQLPHLTIPHSQLTTRRFVLEPLAEIASGLTHPQLGKTVIDLLEECTDPLPVQQWKGNNLS